MAPPMPRAFVSAPTPRRAPSSFDRTTPAFVLGLGRAGLGAIRSLGRQGIAVRGLDPDAGAPGFRSRYCAATLCPDPVRAPEALLQQLVAAGQHLARPALLLATGDEFVLFVARYRDELAPYFLLDIPPLVAVDALVNKRRQYELAGQAGIPIPTTFYPKTPDDIEAIKHRVQYPAIIKPCYGHMWREIFGGQSKAIKVGSPEELEESFRPIPPTGLDILVQSVVIGPATNHFEVSAYVGTSGDVLATFVARKIRQFPPEFGVGCLVESMESPELARLGLDFLRTIDYRGIANIEFKRDQRDGRLKLIELNPRLWSQNELATHCGMNFALLQYLELTGQRPTPLTRFTPGVRWVDPLYDYWAFGEYARRGELRLVDWLRSWRGVRVVATFARDDPQPFLHDIGYGRSALHLPGHVVRYLAQRAARLRWG
jgi:D-aspartate ligase